MPAPLCPKAPEQATASKEKQGQDGWLKSALALFSFWIHLPLRGPLEGLCPYHTLIVLNNSGASSSGRQRLLRAEAPAQQRGHAHRAEPAAKALAKAKKISFAPKLPAQLRQRKTEQPDGEQPRPPARPQAASFPHRRSHRFFACAIFGKILLVYKAPTISIPNTKPRETSASFSVTPLSVSP